MGACARGGEPATSNTGPAAVKKANKQTARPRLPPLGPRERALADELRRDVNKLAAEIGERNAEKKWELADASDYIATELEAAGYAVERQGYEVEQGAVAVQNLEAEVTGGDHGGQVVLVGAHYDTHPGSPGADDNASGVAAVLALARAFRSTRPKRTLRFVFFTNEEMPYFQTQDMGSLRYARQAAARGDEIVGMISVESIGYFSDAPASQRYPEPIAGQYPTVGDFIAVVGDEKSNQLVSSVASSLRQHASIPVESAALDAELPGIGWSDHWSFWQMGIPAVMITDTAPFRYPSYHQANDLPSELDFGRMARVVAGLEGVVSDLAMVGTETAAAR
jgi:hypothetical protein